MKKLLLFFMLLIPISAMAMDVTLQWDENTESDLAGYKVYYGSMPRIYEGSGFSISFIDDENSDPLLFQYTVAGIPTGVETFFAVTAYDAEGLESPYSNEVNVSKDVCVPPATPGNLCIINHICQ